MARLKSIKTGSIILIAFLLALVAAGFGLWLGGWSENGAVLASRYTARLSFYWFMVAWAASSVAQLWKGGWRAGLIARRRTIGLGFAVAFGVHLAALVTAISVFGHNSGVREIIGGGAGYFFAAAMASTSNDRSIKLLGLRRWKLLHSTGGWVIFAIFSLTYFKALATKPLSAAPALLAIVIALVLRLMIAAKRLRQRQPVHCHESILPMWTAECEGPGPDDSRRCLPLFGVPEAIGIAVWRSGLLSA
jgi:methionine sulfoxide reductase heme-binding subunit